MLSRRAIVRALGGGVAAAVAGGGPAWAQGATRPPVMVYKNPT